MNLTRKMRTRLLAVAVAALTVLSAGVTGPAQPASAATFAPIVGAGSTWAYPAIHAWIGSENQQGLTVNYEPNGSSAGRVFFAGGQSDWAQSEIPYGVQDGSNTDSPPARGFAYVPDLAGGLGFMYNLSIGGQRVTNLRLSAAVIASIFTNRITMWNDPRIAADNPGLALPAIQITPVVRSDGDGSTAVFTQWMLATEPSAWQAYCAVVGRSPCTQTSAYPVQAGTNMIGQPGDPGVATYVAQTSSNGAIGYVPYSWALQEAFPVAKVLNAAGYYTAPSAGNVGVSLLDAQFNADGTADLSPVYADTDPRTYELSSYSYIIVPTDPSDGMTTDKGYTLGTFGQYALCQGQQQVAALGYAPLPVNLVEDGFAQLAKIPGASVPATTPAILASCNNPTFSPDGTNLLASTDPMPPACDQQGATQCGPTVGTVTTLTASPDPATTITVSDTRNSYPGWEVSGQAADFTGSGTAAGFTISGNQLGWTPTASSLAPGVTLGGPVTPASPGLGTTSGLLALAHAGRGNGYGTSTLGANLTLAIPPVPESAAGNYASSLTVTAVTSLP